MAQKTAVRARLRIKWIRTFSQPKDIIDMAGERTRGKGPIGKDAFLMDETKPQISEVEGGEKVDYDLKTVPILARYLNIPSP